MTNTEALATLRARFPRVTWTLGLSAPWANVYGSVNGTEIAVMPPDSGIGRPCWRCSVRFLKAATAYTVSANDGESVPELVQRTATEFAEWAVSVREAVFP